MSKLLNQQIKYLLKSYNKCKIFQNNNLPIKKLMKMRMNKLLRGNSKLTLQKII